MSVFEIAKKRKIEQQEKKIEELTKKMQNLQSNLDENQGKIDENEKKKKEYESYSEKSENFQEKINSLSIMLNFFKNLSIIQNITNSLNTQQVFFDMYLSQKNLILTFVCQHTPLTCLDVDFCHAIIDYKFYFCYICIIRIVGSNGKQT